MDIAEKMAADIALAMDGGEWKDGKWYSKFHRDAWIKAVKPYADEIERLREAAKDRPKDRPNEAADEIERLLEVILIAAAILSERGLSVYEKNEMAYEHLSAALKEGE